MVLIIRIFLLMKVFTLFVQNVTRVKRAGSMSSLLVIVDKTKFVIVAMVQSSLIAN